MEQIVFYMNINTFSNLELNIGDRVKIFFNTAAYVQIDGKYADISFDKVGGDDWNAHESFIGLFCGENYKQSNFVLNIVKLRIEEPVKIGKTPYITIPASVIKSIELIQKNKPGVLDMLTHNIGASEPRAKSDVSELKPSSSILTMKT